MSDPPIADNRNGSLPPEAMDAVPVAFVPTGYLGHIVLSILADKGIPARVVGEHSAATFGAASTATSVSVLVPRQEYGRAVEVLGNASRERVERVRMSDARNCPACGYSMRGLEGREQCPECGASIDHMLALRRQMTIAPPPSDSTPMGRTASAVGCLLVVVVLLAVAAWFVMLLYRPAAIAPAP